MKRVIKENDKFIVLSESIITSFDRKIITRLYQPLMGSTSSSLYFTFLSEIEFDNTISKEKREIASLLKLMNCTIGDFILATGKLEGIGLVKTQYNKNNDFYVFSLFAPLSPKDFFDNPLFDSLLQKQLGKDCYDKNKLYFNQSKISNDDLEDVSNNFDDVFSFDGTGSFVGGDNSISKKTNTAKISFNFNAFYLKLKELHVDEIVCKDIEQDIALIAVANKVAAVDMASLIHKSLNSEGKVNLSKLRTLCSNNINLDPIKQIVDTGNSNLNKKIELYNKTNPYEFLVIKNNYAPIASSDKRIIDMLLNEYHLNDAVTNVLLDYVLQVADNKLSRAYIEKVAGSLARSKINDAYSAMTYLTKTPVINKPIEANTKKDIESSVTEEDIAKALEELENIKKARDK